MGEGEQVSQYFDRPQGGGLQHAPNCSTNYVYASHPPKYAACNCGVSFGRAPAHAMRVGPGTDAVVFKTWDTTHTECEI